MHFCHAMEKIISIITEPILSSFFFHMCKFSEENQSIFQKTQARISDILLRPNSPTPLTDNWKVTDDSSVNFHDVFFFIFCQIIAKIEKKHHGNLRMSRP